MKIDRKKSLFFCFSLSIAGGIILSFAFPPFDRWPFAFFALVPLLYAASGNSAKNFLFGTAYGFFFYIFSFFWLYNVAGPVYFLLALYLSLFWGLFLYLVFALPEKGRIFTAAFVFFLLEIIVSNLLTGFPWILLGLSQWRNTAVLKIAGLSGIYGISFLVVLANFFIFYSFGKRHLLSWLAAAAVIAAAFFLPDSVSYGKTYKAGTLSVMVVQPNISSAENRSIYSDLHNIGLLTIENLKDRKPDIVIWPESIFPDDIGAEPEIMEGLKALTEEREIALILGTFTSDGGDFYNSALFVEGGKIRVYRKNHLVPYGEFILGGRLLIIRSIFKKIAGYMPDEKPGSELVVFSVKGARIAPLICFENIFPEMTRSFVREGAEVFAVITNDSWFGRSAGPYQHFAHNALRAAESGRYFVQCSITGISGIVSPCGVIESVAEKNGEKLFVEGVLLHDIPLIQGKTPYAQAGDIPLFILSLIFTGAALCRRK
ncbi:MAG: apolipoprotein N-acyltransferase [Candidatus Omnitrophica bacterium]|nr:apolipoprotein N-acyltransferase [Candidatus Omnitrophota bacterium]